MPPDPYHSGPARFSIVICTDGRSQALANTLASLRYLEGPSFEVVVVAGPTVDGTDAVLAAWAERIKVVRNPERNLSVSRNLGIAASAGEIVAFIDDDGVPEPDWLVDLARDFELPDVGGAGGLVMDYTGSRPQYLYASADRLGNADLTRQTPAEEYSFPLSFNFPYVQGTNSAFRRELLLEVGGFDEEFDFYLDETDVCCRLVDAGWQIRQLPDAVVHHKYLPSAIRNDQRVTRVLYSVLKNKLYFSLVNNRGHFPVRRAIEDMQQFIRDHEHHLRLHLEGGRVQHRDLETFHADVDRAWATGLERGVSGQRRLMDPHLPERLGAPFLPFERPEPQPARHRFAFISQEWPPERMGGIGRYVHQLARAVAALGHHVHVLTRGEGHDRVDFEDGVWVHRLVPAAVPGPPADVLVPAHIWTHGATMLKELHRISTRRPFDTVYAPIWDCEGLAVLIDGTWPLVTGLQTTLHFWLDSNQHLATDADFQRDFATPMLALETWLLAASDAVHAISGAIARDIAARYAVDLGGPRTAVIPLALEDWSELPDTPPDGLPDGGVRLLFVGRLETRKGIDLLLELAPRLLTRYPTMALDIVGNDGIPAPTGSTYRARFEDSVRDELRGRVRFHGEVSEERLRGFYRACDLFVAPSRFESFGLIVLEAMMYGKPVVASRVGGMAEVAVDGETALLAEPGDIVSLEACLDRLLSDADLRRRLGAAGRALYETRFTPQRMAEDIVALMRCARSGASLRMAQPRP